METYTLTLFSADSNNRIGTDISNMTYYVNWDGVIPEKYKCYKFLIKFSFYTDLSSNSNSKSYFIMANGLNLISANFQGMSNVLGCIPICVSRAGSVCTIGCSSVDNPTIMGNYPNSNMLNIIIEDLTNFSGMNNVALLPNYVLTITFTPIKDFNLM
jgi:hypothetical protein